MLPYQLAQANAISHTGLKVAAMME